MNALESPALTPATCLELDAYLHDTRHRLSPSEIANLAIREWLARPENLPALAVPESARGYQWKCLFLPESTRVHMYFKGACFDASVVGDALMFEGRRVSPRQMKARAIDPPERRIAKHRRAEDLMVDDCKFD